MKSIPQSPDKYIGTPDSAGLIRMLLGDRLTRGVKLVLRSDSSIVLEVTAPVNSKPLAIDKQGNSIARVLGGLSDYMRGYMLESEAEWIQLCEAKDAVAIQYD